MKIVVVCEGATEKAFLPHFRKFLSGRLAGKMPKLQTDVHGGSIPTHDKLRRVVNNLLRESDYVVALTDVYPGYQTADEAKQKLRNWVGDEPRFFPHVALHDFEAWLLPYWDRIQKLAGRRAAPFGPHPEQVDHGHPPSKRLKELFEAGTCRDSYNKPRDAGRILRDADLSIAANACPELKALLNTILTLSDPAKILS